MSDDLNIPELIVTKFGTVQYDPDTDTLAMSGFELTVPNKEVVSALSSEVLCTDQAAGVATLQAIINFLSDKLDESLRVLAEQRKDAT